MNKLIILSILIFLGITNISLAEAAQTPEINLIQDIGSNITIEFKLHGYETEILDVDGITCSRIILPGQPFFLEKGLPELPTITRSIIIPDNGLMDYRIIDIEYEINKVNQILPSKGNLLRTIDPKTISYTFDEFYTSDSWWPEKTVEISEPFILRDYRGLTIRFNPFQYNPATNELKIAKRVVIEVYEIGKGGTNILTRQRNYITREFTGIYESMFLNFGARYDAISEQAGRMLVITDDAYEINMEPFVTWKRQKGIDTKLVTISSIGGNIEDSIKNCIQEEYDRGDLIWVLLVGDGNEIVPAKGTMGAALNEDADPVYAYTAGSDYYPDIFISRFSSVSGDSVNIKKQVNRSIGYEKTPMEAADWYHIGLGVASNEGSPPDYTRCEWLAESLLAYNYTEIKEQYQGMGGSTAGIKNDIEAGLSIINYIGHGYTYGWSSVPFSTSNINALDNPWMLPFVISVACLVGNFNGQTCYCEASVTAGEIEQPDGFLVHWGSTINQSWVPPCYGQEGAVNLLTHDQKNSAGGIFFNGACYMIEHYGGGQTGVEVAQTWLIFGDASIQLRTDTPQEMLVDHVGSIEIGEISFSVSVSGVENALVGLYLDSMLIGSGYTDSLGEVTIELDPVPSEPGIMDVTVTAYNKIPYFGTVSIVQGIEEESINLGLSIKNKLTALYPNPFSKSTSIGYQIANVSQQVSISLYDASGRLVRRLINKEIHEPGNYTKIWNGKDDLGRSVNNGIYFIRFLTDTNKEIEKLILLK